MFANLWKPFCDGILIQHKTIAWKENSFKEEG